MSEIGTKGGAASSHKHHVEAGRKGAWVRWTRPLPLPISAKNQKRFWSQVNKTDTCWLWTGCVQYGYGLVGIGGNTFKVQRVSWGITNGQIPHGMLVCHKCDVRNCVNPDHLFLGTHDDNNKDMKRKGRAATGDRNGTRLHPESIPKGEQHWWSAKLNAKTVRAIRSLAAPGSLHGVKAEMARRFGVSQTTIGHVLSRKTWRHVA